MDKQLQHKALAKKQDDILWNISDEMAEQFEFDSPEIMNHRQKQGRAMKALEIWMNNHNDVYRSEKQLQELRDGFEFGISLEIDLTVYRGTNQPELRREFMSVSMSEDCAANFGAVQEITISAGTKMLVVMKGNEQEIILR